MTRLSVKVDTKGMERFLDDASRAILLASTRTANRLIERAKTSGFREVARVYGIGPRDFEQYARVTLARDGEVVAEITVSGRGLPVFHFQPRQTRKGVTVKIKGRRILIPHAFIARTASGHIGVFARGAYGGKGLGANQRSGQTFGRFVFGRGSKKVRGFRPGRGAKRSGLPINEIYTFAPPDAFSSEQVVEAMEARVDEDFDKVMRGELRFALRGR